MGIDEIHIVKKPCCVISNIEHQTIAEVLPNRNKPTVIKRLLMLPSHEKVRYVAMDMWNPYRDAVNTVFPQARIVIDKFHVVRMANQCLETVRKDLRAQLTSRQRKGLMHDRFVLLKRRHDISDEDYLKLSGCGLSTIPRWERPTTPRRLSMVSGIWTTGLTRKVLMKSGVRACPRR